MNIENKIKASIEQEKLENELSHKKYELENLNKEKTKQNEQLKAQIKEYQKALDETMSEKIDIEDNWNKLKEWLNNFHKLSEFEQWEIVNKMQEIEQGSDSNV